MWDDRIALYVAFLIQCKRRSSTIKSYISALRCILKHIGIKVQKDNAVLGSLIKACKLKNDVIQTRLPIKQGLLHILITSVDKIFSAPQPYLSTMYKALIATAYFGMFRVGEITASSYVVKACDVQIALNKEKMMFVLRSSKTHNKGCKPQIIKICGNEEPDRIIAPSSKLNRHCPFKLLQNFIKVRKPYRSDFEQFFIFSDNSPVTPLHFRLMLKRLLAFNKLDSRLYCTQGFRAGMATDLLEQGVSVETIRNLGRWKSNTVYTYLRA